MDNAAYAYTKDGFDKAMEEMKKQCELAWTWLIKIPVNTWARWAMDTNCCTDLVVNSWTFFYCLDFYGWHSWTFFYCLDFYSYCLSK
jgi:hypothetical protein